MASANTVEIVFKATDQASVPIKALAQGFDDMGRKIVAAGRSISGSTAGITSVSRAVEQLGGSSAVAAASVTKIGASFSSAAQNAVGAATGLRAVGGAAQAVAGASKGVAELGQATTRAGAAASAAAAGFQTLGAGAGAGVNQLAQQLQRIPGMLSGIKIGPSFDALLDSVRRVKDEIAVFGRATPESLRAAQKAVEDLTKTYGRNLEAAKGITEGQRAAFGSARDEIAKVNNAWAGQSRAAQAAAHAGTQAMSGLGAAAAGLGRQLLLVLGPLATLAGAFALLKKALANADELRDLAAGIRIVSGSAQEAGETLAFFTENAKRTRSTNDELAESFRNLFPSAKRMGFDAAQFREMTVTIHNFATAINEDVETVESAWVQLTSGRITGTNAIVKALGLDAAALRANKISIGEFVGSAVEGMQRVAAEGEKMGQTFASTAKLATDALLDAFGEGFNQAAGKAQTGMQGVLDALTDPRILEALQTLGRVFAELGPIIAKSLDIAVKGILALVNSTPIARLLAVIDGVKKLAGGGITSGGHSSVTVGAGAAPPKKFNIVDPDALAATKKATDAVARFAQELDALTVSEKATAGEQRLLTAAVARFGDVAKAANVDKIRQGIVALGDSMVQAHRKMDTGFKGLYLSMKAVEENLKVDWDEVFQADEFERVRQKILAGGFGIPLKLIIQPEIKRNAFDRIIKDMQRDLSRSFSGAFTDAFADIFATGGENLKDILAGAIQQGAKIGADTLFKLLSQAVGAAFGKVQKKPGETTEAFQARQQEAGGDILGPYIQAGLSALQLYNVAANPNPQSDTGTVLGGVMAGASLGGAIGSIFPGIGTAIGAVVGAIVGLIVGGISAAMSSVSDDYKYGIPSIRGGQAQFDATQNIPGTEATSIERRMQGVFDTFYNGFTRILLKVSDFLPDFIRNMNINFTQGLDRGGYIGRAASAHFLQHLDTLIREGIPSEVGRAFKPAFQAAFEQIGYSTGRFAELWKMLEGLDPQKGLQLLEILVDIGLGLERFKDLQWNTTVGPGFDIQTGILQEEYRRSQRTPAEALSEDLGSKIRDYADSLSQLTGEAQITRAQELVSLMDQWGEAARNVAREQLAATEAIEKSFGATIRELELEGLKKPGGEADTQAQVEYLKRYADELMAQLPQASSFAEATQMADEIRAIILRIKQLGGTLGDGADEAYRLWALENLKQVQQIALDRIKALGQQMEEQTNALREAIQGMIDAFLGATDRLNEGERERPEPPPIVPRHERPEWTGGGGPPPREDLPRPQSFIVPDDVWQPIVTLPFDELALEAGTLRERFRAMSEEFQANGMDPGGSYGVVTPEFASQIKVIEGLSHQVQETMGGLTEFGEGLHERRVDLEEFGRTLKDLAATRIEIRAETLEPSTPPDRPLTYPEDRAEERQRIAENTAVLEEIRDEIRAGRGADGATANRIASALEDGVRVEGGEFRIIVEQEGARVADFTSRIQQSRVGRGRR